MEYLQFWQFGTFLKLKGLNSGLSGSSVIDHAEVVRRLGPASGVNSDIDGLALGLLGMSAMMHFVNLTSTPQSSSLNCRPLMEYNIVQRIRMDSCPLLLIRFCRSLDVSLFVCIGGLLAKERIVGGKNMHL